MSDNWIGIEKARKLCPICGKNDWCQITIDGSTARCMRVESDKLKIGKDGSHGWLHNITEDIQVNPVLVKQVNKPPKIRPERWFELAMGYRAGCDLMPLSAELGVSVASLERMETGSGLIKYKPDQPARQCWTFPMRDGNENIIGIRTRHAGRKASYPGSENGLFIPDEICSSELVIVEGATDPPALLDIGIEGVIGRANCNSGINHIQCYIKRTKPKKIIIVTDNDEPKKRPDGSVWFPGQDGSLRLAKELPYKDIPVYIIKPIRCKDVREWVQNGLTRQLFYSVVKNTRRFL